MARGPYVHHRPGRKSQSGPNVDMTGKRHALAFEDLPIQRHNLQIIENTECPQCKVTYREKCINKDGKPVQPHPGRRRLAVRAYNAQFFESDPKDQRAMSIEDFRQKLVEKGLL